MGTKRLGDFPFVFMSYDEPWADEYWRDLKQKVPHAKRVHGVKGLDACHKAAADTVPGNWVVTVDADTRIDARMGDVRVPTHLLKDQYRLDWMARNNVNGLWSGNGSVKLWSKRIIRDMKTHEAASPDALSVDHDIGSVIPGQSGQITLPERLAETSPAKTAYQAFRCGFREAVFLYQMCINEKQRLDLASFQDAGVARVLRVWCSIGRHAANGLWVIYGARLGLAMPQLMDSWDPRMVNDYAQLNKLWSQQVRPNFETGRHQSWNWKKLDDKCRALAGFLLQHLDFQIEEFSAQQSQALAELDNLSPTAAASRHDALGYRLMIKAKTTDELEAAKNHLEVSRFLGHPAAYNNMGLINLNDLKEPRSNEAALWNFQAAGLLGNTDGRANADKNSRLSKTQAEPAKRATDYPIICQYDPEIEEPDPNLPVTWAVNGTGDLADILSGITEKYCFVFDEQLRPTPAMANHIPVLDLCADGAGVSYAWTCATSGRTELGGISLVSTKAGLMPSSSAALPIVLGQRAMFQTAEQALRAARSDATTTTIDARFLTVGKDAQFGTEYVFALLSLLTGSREADIDVSNATDDAIAGLLDKYSTHSLAPPLNWGADQSRGLKSLLPDIPPPAVWKAAAVSLNAHSSSASENWSDIVQRTGRSVWGMK